jgi:glycosyltransferase involved in cell wall biosynthesis
MAPELAPKVKTVPIPAGMDITGQSYAARPDTILFLAAYRHRQVNVDAALWFYREVFPLVRHEIPEARFIIAGNGPPEELTVLAATDSQVEVTGFVDDIDRCYKEAAVFVAPILTGGGIIVKILDALAAGRPVVATSIGNEGIAAMPGRDLLVADDPPTFAAQVVKLLREPEYARALAANGAEFVKKNYGIDSVIAKLEHTLAEVAKKDRQDS